jgi:hypothetical protein
MSNEKSKTVDAVNHPETKALMKIMGATVIASRYAAPVAIAGVGVKAAVGVASTAGWGPTGLAVAAYVAHIRQVEQQAQTGPTARQNHDHEMGRNHCQTFYSRGRGITR